MSKRLIKGIAGVLLLGVCGAFVFRLYQQREGLSEFYSWLISGRYALEGVNVGQMQQYLMIKELNDSIPPLVKIYNAGASSGAGVLEKADVEECRKYYHKVLGYMPQMKEAHVFLGWCEDQAGNIPDAFLEFKQGLGSDAGIFWASYNLGVLAMLNGNNDAAEAFFFQVVKFPLEPVLKNILASKLFEQYMQVNNLTPQKILEGIMEARDEAVQNLKSIEENKASASPVLAKSKMRLRIF